VRRIEAYVATTGLAGRSLLDVGSGLGVFPAAMKDAGWNCAALDPDPRAIALVRDAAGVEGICGDFMQLVPSGRFHLVTFNKVLEHVPDPASMLTRSSDWLSPGGTVYVELPDGEGAIAEGPGREEFLVEHYHAFSATSVTLLARHAGFSSRVVERVREPSGKFTLYAFLTRSQ
jgi:SAM-dependent methyltransferase